MSGSNNTGLMWGGDSTQSNDYLRSSSSGNKWGILAVSNSVILQLDSTSNDDEEHGTSGGSGSGVVWKTVPTFKYASDLKTTK